MWSGISVYLSRGLPVSVEAEVKRCLAKNGATISHNFRPQYDYYIIGQFESDFPNEVTEINRLAKSAGYEPKIIGSNIILESEEMHKPLPPVSFMPCFTRILEGVTICISGTTGDKKKQVQILVSYMMGKFADALSADVTYLLVQKAGSEKHQAALNYGVKLLRYAWLADSWRKKRRLPTIDYLVRPFEGFVMAISGLPTEKREQMRSDAAKNGGKIVEDLSLSEKVSVEYTHLIVDPNNVNISERSKYWAVRKYIPSCKIVSVGWFDECMRRQCWINEEPYLVTDEMVGFVPTNDVVISEEDLKKVENSNPSEELHRIDEELQNNKNGNPSNGDNTNGGMKLERSNSDDEGNLIFDGCRIFLSGFKEEQNVRIKNIIVSGGGIRWPTLDGRVTHFIVGSTIQSEIDQFRSVNISAPILTPKWLLDCYKNRMLLLPDKYRFVPANPNRGTKRKSHENSDEYEPQAKRVKLEPQQRTYEDIDMDQELSSSPFDPNALFNKINFLVANFQRDADIRDIQGFIEAQGGRAFIPAALRKIRERGDNQTLINYVVMPHGSPIMESYLDMILPYKGAPKPPAVSIHWIEVSLARKRLMSPSDCIVFRPFPFSVSHYKPTMEKFMICTSNFEQEERENLELLIRLVGASYSAVLKTQSVTHLLCKEPKGPKYEKAIECDIRVVTVQWLEECITKGYHVPESKHSFFGLNNRHNTSYTNREVTTAASRVKKQARSAPTSDDLFKEDENLNNPIAFEEDEMSNSEYYNLPAEVDLLPLSMDRPIKTERDYDKKPIKHEDPRISDVLKDVTIYVGKKLVDIQSEMIDIVSCLGGNYSWCYDENVTHYIHDGRHENNSEFKLIKKNNTQVVSSYWLRKCKEENRRVPEGPFPSTYNPNFSLGQLLTAAPTTSTPAKPSLRTSLVQSPVIQQNKSAPNSTSTSRKRKTSPTAATASSTIKKKKTETHLNVTYFPSSPNSSPNEDRHDANATLLPSPSFRSQRDASGLFTRPVAATPSHHAIKKQPVKESKFFTIGEDSAPIKQERDSRDFQSKINATANDDVVPHVKQEMNVDTSDNDQYNMETMTDLPNLEFLEALKQENSPEQVEEDTANSEMLNNLEELMETVTSRPFKPFKPKDSKLQVEGTARRISRAELLDDPFSQRVRADVSLNVTLNQSVAEIKDAVNETRSESMAVDLTVNASTELEQEELDSQVIAYKSEMETGTATPSQRRDKRRISKPDEGIDRFLRALDFDEESQKKTSMTNLLAKSPTKAPPQKKVVAPKPVPQQLQPEIRINNNPPAAPKQPNRISPVSPSADPTDKRLKESPRTSPAKDAPRFSISGFDTVDAKNSMPKIIKDLGGVFMKHFDSTCTHVIAHKPIRSEKYLGACAMGIWVLKSSYLDACHKAGKFVNEEPYEWTAADAANPREKDLLEAARRWRIKLAQERKKGAFDGWRVILFVMPKRQDGLRRVLESGGAVVIEDTPPFKQVHTVTHIIIDKIKLSDTAIMTQFKHASAPVYATEYISDFIMAYDSPLALETYDILGKYNPKSAISTGVSPSNNSKRK